MAVDGIVVVVVVGGGGTTTTGRSENGRSGTGGFHLEIKRILRFGRIVVVVIRTAAQ